MACVESIIGGIHRSIIKERVCLVDEHYAKKWLIRGDAEDLLALRCQSISLDEHYASLYGPRIMVHQNEISKLLKAGATSKALSNSQENNQIPKRKLVQSQTMMESESSDHMHRHH